MTTDRVRIPTPLAPFIPLPIMPNRTRTRPSTYTRKFPNGITTSNEDFSEIMHDNNDRVVANRLKNKDCTHIVARTPFNGKLSDLSTVVGYLRTNNALSIFNDLYAQEMQKVYIPLDFQKDDNFELFTALADLDSTIATFSKKTLAGLFRPKPTIKNGKKGSSLLTSSGVAEAGAVYQWAALPLLSDLKSLYNSVQSTYNGQFARELEMLNGKRTTRRFQVNRETRSYRFEGSAVLQGRVIVDPNSMPSSAGGSPLNSLKILLDELGVHPDLRTVWDIVPLSFVVDYLIPVGDTLEKVHPRGWFSPQFRFTGQFTLFGTLTVFVEQDRRKQTSFEVYRRGTAPLTMSSRQANDMEVPQMDSLSALELGNIAILSKLRSR